MLKGTRRLFLSLVLISLFASSSTQAQQACKKITATTRGQSSVTTTDQRNIEACLREQLQEATGVEKSVRMKTVVEQFRAHREDPANSAAFLDALRAAATAVAQTELARQDLDAMVALGLARGLFDLGGTDSISAWLVGLRSNVEAVRYLSARALASPRIQAVILGTRNLPAGVADALKQAGQAEQSAAPKRQMYRALSQLAFSQNVLDAYLAMMDKEIERLRGPAVRVTGSELPAYRHLASSPLTTDQKGQVVARLGPLLGYAAARYTLQGAPHHEEREEAERCLYFIDEALGSIVTGGGQIRQIMNNAGDALAVRQEVIRWIGDADTNIKGVLNDPPYNLALGAP